MPTARRHRHDQPCATPLGSLVAIAVLLLGGGTAAAADGALPTPEPYVFDHTYPWQESDAEVLPSGNLAWAPRPFEFVAGDSVRYIDYENGDDGNDGTAKGSAWKHHPWDPAAGGRAKACSGIHTYVFKGGVTYRGTLEVAESGAPGNPIRLTRDPAWGDGPAVFSGSTTIAGGWTRADAASAPDIPEPERVWYIDLGKDYDRDGGNADFSAIWQVAEDDTERLHVARTPNYHQPDPSRPLANWPSFKKIDVKAKTFYSPSITELKGTGPAELKDVVVWATAPSLMGSAYLRNVSSAKWDLDAGAITTGAFGNAHNYNRMRQWNKFMIENAAVLLDADGEFFFARRGPHAGRLYLRPVGGVDPNSVVYEVAQRHMFITMEDKRHIEISGLDFRFNDPDNNSRADNTRHNTEPAPCILAIGDCQHITVANNRFHHVADAVETRLRRVGRGGSKGQVLDHIVYRDNEIRHASGAGVMAILGPDFHGIHPKDQVYGRVKHVEVKRNKLYNTGFRGARKRWDSLPAITVLYPETCEISGNFVERSMGIGIITYGGKSSGHTNREAPLVRYLIHHNQLELTMLGANDYGGLEHFQGGPTYIFNNVSRNTVGNRSFWGHMLGYNLYLDGGFKCYSFNNILAGDVREGEPEFYSHCGYFMVFGFMNQFFNNTIYRFENGIDGSSGNRSNVVGNLITNCHNAFIRQNRSGDHSMMGGGDTGEMGRLGIPTMAYASNMFFGSPKIFGEVAGTRQAGQRKADVVKGETIEALREALAANQCRLSGVGVMADKQPLADPGGLDYRPTVDPAADGRGVKYFVPWALARMVGEWNFYQSESTPQIVLGEHFYMTDEYTGRRNYYHLPRMDLTVSDCTADDYVSGELEDWVAGALTFDGERTAVLSHAEMTKDMAYSRKGGKVEYDGSRRETVDMDTNNFLIEIMLRTEAGTGTLAGKSDGSNGYALSVADNGGVRLTLHVAGNAVSAGSTVRINDGEWHHVIAEVDRGAGSVTFYVDGQAAGTTQVDIAAEASLANPADFVVGEGFVGAIDFLRLARSTLAESLTDIDELYTWQFDGPHLRDFAGVEPEGMRSPGALHGE